MSDVIKLLGPSPQKVSDDLHEVDDIEFAADYKALHRAWKNASRLQIVSDKLTVLHKEKRRARRILDDSIQTVFDEINCRDREKLKTAQRAVFEAEVSISGDVLRGPCKLYIFECCPDVVLPVSPATPRSPMGFCDQPISYDQPLDGIKADECHLDVPCTSKDCQTDYFIVCMGVSCLNLKMKQWTRKCCNLGQQDAHHLDLEVLERDAPVYALFVALSAISSVSCVCCFVFLCVSCVSHCCCFQVMLFCAEASCCSSDFQSGDKSCTVRTLPETRYRSDADSMRESYKPESDESKETTNDFTSFMEMNVFFMNPEDRTKFSTSCQEVARTPVFDVDCAVPLGVLLFWIHEKHVHLHKTCEIVRRLFRHIRLGFIRLAHRISIRSVPSFWQCTNCATFIPTLKVG